MYNPQYKSYEAKQTSWWERTKDKLFGTNYQGRADLENQQRALEAQANNNYEFQKAVNINKYSWNQQGMVEAGINPLAASGNIGTVSNSAPVGSAGSMDQGGTGEISDGIFKGMKDLLHEISPSTMIRDVKDLVKNTTSSYMHGGYRRN